MLNKHFVDVDNTDNGHFKCDRHTQETKNKISSAMIGKRKSQSTKDKMKIVANNRPPNYYDYVKGVAKGTVFTEQHKKNISTGTKGRYNRSDLYKWSTDGVSSARCDPEMAPHGWVNGRTTKANKSYVVVCPDGSKHNTNNLYLFCRNVEEVKLDPEELRRTGALRNFHKGYRVE